MVDGLGIREGPRRAIEFEEVQEPRRVLSFKARLYGGMDEPDITIIDVWICELKKKLSFACGGANYIETVRGRGYVLREHEQLALASLCPLHTTRATRVAFRACGNRLAARPLLKHYLEVDFGLNCQVIPSSRLSLCGKLRLSVNDSRV